MSILKKAAKGIGKAAKSIGNAVAVETHMPRPFATKTANLAPNNDETLTEIKNFIEITKKIENLAKQSHFSHLEKLARKTKDDLKSLFSKAKTESSEGNILPANIELYKSKKYAFLNKAHELSINIYAICKLVEVKFKDELCEYYHKKLEDADTFYTDQKFM